MRAAQSQAPGSQPALAELCRLYWSPLCMFACIRGPLREEVSRSVSDQADHARRLKRGGDKEFVHLDAQDAEERYRMEPVELLTAEKMFDARWAMTLLAEALNRLHQEYAAEGKTSTFEALRAFLDPMNSSLLPSYEEVAKRLGLGTGGIKTLIHRLRKRYTALLREEVGRTVSDPAEIDEEIHALCDALITSEGRLGP